MNSYTFSEVMKTKINELHTEAARERLVREAQAQQHRPAESTVVNVPQKPTGKPRILRLLPFLR